MKNTEKYAPKNMVVSFSRRRHDSLNFPYLKENGELLMIVNTSGYKIDEISLESYRIFYERAKKFCEFFPQYYRFILGITMELEDLGMRGSVGEELCDLAVSQKYFQFETSDLRRMEILNLLRRRNYDSKLRETYGGQGLEDRVFEFMCNPKCFVKFNRPFFYEMTHYIFYLTQFGKKLVNLPSSIFEGLDNIGNLALLDNDIDLLSEICLCFHFCKRKPPLFWEQYIQAATDNFAISFEEEEYPDPLKLTDDYHNYLTINWLQAYTGKPAFTHKFTGSTPYFYKPQRGRSALSEISSALYTLSFHGGSLAEYTMPDYSTILSDNNKAIVSNLVKTTISASSLIEAYSDGRFVANELYN